MSAASFFSDVVDDARAAARMTGVPVSVILAQWAVETGFGTSAAWREGHNYAGVSSGGRPVRYRDRVAGLAAYVATLKGPRYTAVREAGTSAAAARALGASPWDEGLYGGDGSTLTKTMDAQHLARYDSLPAWVDGSSGLIDAARDAVTSVADKAKDVAGDAIGAAIEPYKQLALRMVFVAAGVGLVVAGAWTAVAPRVRPVLERARERTEQAVAAAAVVA